MKLIHQLEYEWEQKDSLTGAIPLTAASTAVILQELLESVNQCVVAFDLDSTLLNNRPRNAAIMQEFGELHSEPILCNASAIHFQDWSARNAMINMGLDHESMDRLIDLYQAYWSERFFTTEYCKYDIAIPGAVEFVGAVQDNGGTICYLTGRHEGMRAGTEASLEQLGFPVPAGMSDTNLLMKPDPDQSDDFFKVEALQRLEGLGRLHAAFDNEPTHINSYRRAFSNATCIHLLTDHSMRDVQLLDQILTIRDFVR